ncbi:MAG: methyltransferase domain-containing protein [Rhodospirillaceae bacterium]|nr:methyltransferase domain-containing protein [Rhodospirillaceae bacterium]
MGVLANVDYCVAEPILEKHKIWDSYWLDSRMNSTVAESSPEAEATLEAHWREFFAEVPNGGVILDLGCGNGAVALTAMRVSQETGKGFKVHGLDSPAIDPAKYVTREELLKQIEFVGQVPMESLPYQAGQFDAVVSQYGIEFADSRAIGEAARVLKKGGRFCAITFAANTPAVVQSASKMPKPVSHQQSQAIRHGHGCCSGPA